MRFTAIFAFLAFGSCLGMTAVLNSSKIALGIESTMVHSGLEKRDAFTCYGSTNTSVSDCQKIIDTIRIDEQQEFALYSGVCAVWNQGSCRVRFCAQPYVNRPVNRSATWLTTYIASPLLDGCIGKGNLGVMADHTNINSHYGTYRLWVD
ncbi:hypothetical protein GL218_02302 [Daldinia childiae]|uniref:uncharacterized protein n=1 Tax=Daldinia childiae TaxID=326645 RepID=UPI001448750E|nr:uncharacterized protein GL218_02302 [Daldinia childiae]KAF3063917.1 hypothetical protein GL218_02302 [Daldinia childiae]